MAFLLRNEKRVTARRVRQRIGAVMRWAVAQGYRQDNPAGEATGAALPKNGFRPQHHRALPYAEVGDAIEQVRGSGAYPATALAFEFLVLTACRSGEVRGALWNEMNLEAGEWRIPAERMKTHREHRVPLSRRALAVLREAQRLADGSGLVFPSARGRPLSEVAISKMVRDLRIGAVPHGFRSSFRDWAAECTDAPREVCELALAHVNTNRIGAAYRRTDMFEQRRVLMDQWAAFLAGPAASYPAAALRERVSTARRMPHTIQSRHGEGGPNQPSGRGSESGASRRAASGGGAVRAPRLGH